MEKSLFRYLWRETRNQQIFAAIITCSAFPFFYILLNIPKEIIDDTLGANPNMQPFPREIVGFSFSQIEYLFLLCGAFLALVGVNGFIKMKVNTYKGIIAEGALQKLRYALIERVLRFPRAQFHRTSSGELVSMVTAEVEPLGGYVGDAIAQPLYQGGLMLTIVVFVFVQNPLLGLAAISLVPVQAYVIPILQRKVNALNKERVKRVRGLSEQISESVDGVDELRVQGAILFFMARFSGHLSELFSIRLKIFKTKFLMKFLNNFIGQLTPFLFFAVGGYLVISGDLLIGALIAGLAAYERLDAPWRELLAYYQQLQDARTRYALLIENFDVDGVLDEALVIGPPNDPPRLTDSLRFAGLTISDNDGRRLLDEVDLELPAGGMIGIVSRDPGALDRVAQVMIRAEPPTHGELFFGDIALSALHQSVIGRRVGYLSRDYHLFNGTVADNLHLGFMQRPPTHIESAPAFGDGDFEHSAYGFNDREDLVAFWWEAVQALGVADELFSTALKLTPDPARYPGLMRRIVEARPAIRRVLAEQVVSNAVQHFDPLVFNPYMTLGENIIFGTARDELLTPFNMASDVFVRQTIDAVKLTEVFQSLGIRIGQVLLDLFKDAAPDDPLFEKYGFVDASVLDRLRALKAPLLAGRLDQLTPKDAELILSLPFRLNPSRHRFIVIDTALKLKIIAARQYFSEWRPDRLDDAVERFDFEVYNSKLPVKCNLIFGRIASDIGGAAEAAENAMRHVADELGLKRDITLLVGNMVTGVGGSRLPVAARERIALLRNIVKRPDLIVFNQTLRGRDEEGRAHVRAIVRRLLPDTTIVWLDTKIAETDDFDEVLYLEHGKLTGSAAPTIRDGAPDLMKDDVTALRQTTFFADLPLGIVQKIAFASERISFKAGETIFSKNDDASSVFVFLEGVAVEEPQDDKGNESVIKVVTPGRLIGEVAALAGGKRPHTLVAQTTVRALTIHADALRDAIAADRASAAATMRALSLKLQNEREKSAHLTLES